MTAVGRFLNALVLATACGGGAAPRASADESQYTEFYTPPQPLPLGAPGDLIRSEPSRPGRLRPTSPNYGDY